MQQKDRGVAHAPIDVAWAAGLFEGEGCIYLDTYRESQGTGRVRIGLELATTDEDVVRRFHAAVARGKVQGPYRNAKSTKPYWTWQARREADVRAVVALLEPMLGERRRETIAAAFARLEESDRSYVPRPKGPVPAPRIHARQMEIG